MWPFLNALREPLNVILRLLHVHVRCKMSQEARDDLGIFAAFLLDENSFNPIPQRP
jgi:hypothetical protein